jgi:hypothetical protein
MFKPISVARNMLASQNTTDYSSTASHQYMNISNVCNGSPLSVLIASVQSGVGTTSDQPHLVLHLLHRAALHIQAWNRQLDASLALDTVTLSHSLKPQIAVGKYCVVALDVEDEFSN